MALFLQLPPLFRHCRLAYIVCLLLIIALHSTQPHYACAQAPTPKASSVKNSLPSSVSHAETAIQTAIRTVLDDQVRAWNAGNVEEFMQGYDNSDSLRFASGGSIQRGWNTTLERYRKSYPDKTAMGMLQFSNLETTVFSHNAALVFGRWQLIRMSGNSQTHATDTLGGLFTLTFRKTSRGWKIIHDHTSSGK